MATLVDCHVHLYPFHDVGRLLDRLWRNVNVASADRPETLVLVLTETAGCDAFDALAGGRRSAGDWRAQPGADGLSLRFDRATPAAGPIWMIRGRQWSTAERIEVHAVGFHENGGDGLPAATLIRRLTGLRVPALLPWAPGKWFGRRGRLVRRLMDEFGPERLALSDSTLRPSEWPTPRLFREARRRGFRVVGGSDPLAFPGEERWVATYATAVAADLDPAAPATSVQRVLMDPCATVVLRGTRPCAAEVALRIARHLCAKKRRSLRS